MSVETVKTLLARAVAEPAFRALLLHDPAQALAGYTLSEPETAALTALRPEAFDAAAAGLEARISRVTLPNLQADGTIKDEGIASEIVLAHELTHPIQ